MSYAYCPHCGVKLPPDVEAVPVQPFPYYPPGVRGEPFDRPTWAPPGGVVWCGPGLNVNTVPASQQTVTIPPPEGLN